MNDPFTVGMLWCIAFFVLIFTLVQYGVLDISVLEAWG